jgi:heterodisulfide reductase subunit A-like polyferredoxin
MNSRNKSLTCSPQVHPPGKEPAVSKIGLAQYYLQFCAINSQLGNHSGALVSARKALQLIRNELKEWKRLHEKNDKGKGRAEW